MRDGPGAGGLMCRDLLPILDSAIRRWERGVNDYHHTHGPQQKTDDAVSSEVMSFAKWHGRKLPCW